MQRKELSNGLMLAWSGPALPGSPGLVHAADSVIRNLASPKSSQITPKGHEGQRWGGLEPWTLLEEGNRDNSPSPGVPGICFSQLNS